MAVHHLQQLIGGTVGGQRVGRGVVAVEPVFAVLIGAEFAPQVVGGLIIRVLKVVLAVGRSLPDVEDGVGNRLPGDQVADDTVHQAHATVGSWVLDNGASIFAERSVWRPKGPEDGRRRGVDTRIRDDLVGNLVYEATGWLA